MARFTKLGASTAVAAVMAASLWCGSPAAQADPDAVARAQEQLARIEAESSAIDARYIELQEKLDQASKRLARADKDLASQDATVDELSRSLGQFAAERYQTSGVDMTTRLLTSQDEADFLGQLAQVQSVTDRANQRVQELQLAQADLAVSQQSAAESRRQIAAAKSAQAKASQEYHRKQDEAQKVLDKLTAEEKKRLAEIERKQEAERQAKAKKAIEAARAAEQARTAEADRAAEAAASPSPTAIPSSSSGAGTGSESSPESSAGPATAGSGRAGTAVSFALSQVGKSYVMGATGPGAYDCSGLMLRAWEKAGVGLPRTSQAQFGAGTSIPTSQLQPGDLVFYYSGISHVGMYIGNGMIVHAANPRSGVKVAPVDQMPLTGARRVG
ncbi:NlpC/P60 family protein [Luteococcus sp.]|uniref:C40 family peptidase n=1 Tax=Luteococcus sp. TaxID=1969402 RepID=UPI00373625E9